MTELLSDPKHIRGDLRQIEQSLRRGFDIPDLLFSRTAHVVGQLLKDGKPAREQLAAARVVIALAEYNRSLQPSPAQVEHEHHHTHDIGPVTESNIEAQRAKRSARLAGRL
jgi:hypothetical protein